MASGGAAKTAAATTFAIDFDPAPVADPTDPTQLAYYQRFIGKVIGDEAMTDLYLAAHRNGFKLTSEAQGRWWQECDYLVTSARFV